MSEDLTFFFYLHQYWNILNCEFHVHEAQSVMCRESIDICVRLIAKHRSFCFTHQVFWGHDAPYIVLTHGCHVRNYSHPCVLKSHVIIHQIIFQGFLSGFYIPRRNSHSVK